jgi:hypothetical protein
MKSNLDINDTKSFLNFPPSFPDEIRYCENLLSLPLNKRKKEIAVKEFFFT